MFSAIIPLPLWPSRRPLRNRAIAHDTKHKVNVPSTFIVKIQPVERSETSDAEANSDTSPQAVSTVMGTAVHTFSVLNFVHAVPIHIYYNDDDTNQQHTTIYTWLDGIITILRGSSTQAEYNSASFVWHKAVGSSQFYELFRNKQVDAYVSSSEHY
jgi:hypothetical protein